jgi:hypothetical protein
MNPRHAAALVLCGWYLMMPPPYWSKTNPRTAPLRQWRVFGRYDSARECSDERTILKRTPQLEPAEGPAPCLRGLVLKSFRGEMMKRMSIRPVAAGRYATLCAQGYWPCARGESRSVTIPYDAIDLAFEEGSDSYKYWDPKTRSFKSVDMSD